MLVFFTPGLPESHSRLWICIIIEYEPSVERLYAPAHLVHFPASVLLASTVDALLHLLILCFLDAIRLLRLLELEFVLFNVLGCG